MSTNLLTFLVLLVSSSSSSSSSCNCWCCQAFLLLQPSFSSRSRFHHHPFTFLPDGAGGFRHRHCHRHHHKVSLTKNRFWSSLSSSSNTVNYLKNNDVDDDDDDDQDHNNSVDHRSLPVQSQAGQSQQQSFHRHLIILLPAFNESLRIPETLRLYHDYLYNQLNLNNQEDPSYYDSCEILVVDDGSTDGTANVVESISMEIQQKQKNQLNQQQSISTANENKGVVVPIRCVSLPYNQGKGAALAEGIQHVSSRDAKQQQQQNNNNHRSTFVLIADADGSADITCLEDFFVRLQELVVATTDQGKTNNGDPQRQHDDENHRHPSVAVEALVVGRRIDDNDHNDEHDHDDDNNCNTSLVTDSSSSSSSSSSSLLRPILRWGFRTCVKMICGGSQNIGNVTDTQCGFKLMTLPAAKLLYTNLNLKGWSHDVEVLYRAGRIINNNSLDAGQQNQQQKGDDHPKDNDSHLVVLVVGEQDVRWKDKEGSKLINTSSSSLGSGGGGIVEVSMKMLLEIVQLRLLYSMGFWE